MSLADLLRSERDDVLTEFVRRVRELHPPEHQHSESVLLDGLPRFFDNLIADLDAATDPAASSTSSRPTRDGAEHGEQRQGLGLDLVTLAREWAILRDVVLERLIQREATVAMTEYQTLSRHVSLGAIASVESFVAASAQERRRTTAEHAATLAHDLRNQLTVALAALDMVARQELRELAIGWLEESLGTMQRTLERELTAARLEALEGTQDLHLENLSIGRLLSDVVKEVAPLGRARGVQVIISESLDGLQVAADRRLVHSALVNLIGNAVKYTPDHGTVIVAAAVRDDLVAFEISDQCGGLAPGDEATMFAAHTPGRHARSGVGLGLVISRQALQAHGGSLRVVDVPGHGCVTIATLPRRPRG